MDYPERPECDFTGPFQTRVQEQLELFLPDGEVRCTHCRRVVPQPFYVKKHFGLVTRDMPFCNEQHSQDYYMSQMRSQEGL